MNLSKLKDRSDRAHCRGPATTARCVWSSIPRPTFLDIDSPPSTALLSVTWTTSVKPGASAQMKSMLVWNSCNAQTCWSRITG